MKSIHRKYWLPIILVLSVLLRIGAALYLGDTVEILPGTYDQVSYHNLALRVIDGHGFSFDQEWWPITPAGEPTAHWSYLYTFYLVAVYALFGPHPLAARLIQALIVGSLHPWLAYLIGKRIMPSSLREASPQGAGRGEKVGLAAAFLTAIYIYFIYYAGTLMTEPFYITAILGTLYLTMRLAEVGQDDILSYKLVIGLGLTLGVTVLLRQLFMLFVPFLFLWMWWVWCRTKNLNAHVISQRGRCANPGKGEAILFWDRLRLLRLPNGSPTKKPYTMSLRSSFTAEAISCAKGETASRENARTWSPLQGSDIREVKRNSFWHSLRLPLFSTAIPIVILFIMILPFTLYNYARFDRFVLLNTNAGYAFFWGNHPVYGTHFHGILPPELGTYQDLIPAELRHLDEAALDQALLKRGLGFVMDDPGRYLLLSISRVREYIKFWPSPESSTISNISRIFSFGILWPFMLYGLFLSLRKPPPLTPNLLTPNSNLLTSPKPLLILFVTVYTAIHLLSWTLIRYRLPVDAVLLIFAGLAIDDLSVRLQNHRRHPLPSTS
ncbi:MAG: glycosyltransferase family 39 protein [Chloroflexi bacterium]|nr:glycosyltransferase family 39 protein [Chloroflexota bacterium]MBU1660659.1 glycosyltransferase family 39 protein [Chloroflexota bacterium]